MWNGKRKAITFSYDDGVLQDRRLIKILDKYGLRATFNINSELLAKPGVLVRGGISVAHCKWRHEEVARIYLPHEVAVHTLTHPLLPSIEDDSEVIRQVEEDRKNLGQLTGENIVGMAYPGGGVNHDLRVANLIRANTGVKYARTTVCTGTFALPEDMLLLNPTAFHLDFDTLYTLADAFFADTSDEPLLFYIWGHSYEFDIDDTWEQFEEFCAYIANHDDVFYGTNREVLIDNI